MLLEVFVKMFLGHLGEFLDILLLRLGSSLVVVLDELSDFLHQFLVESLNHPFGLLVAGVLGFFDLLDHFFVVLGNFHVHLMVLIALLDRLFDDVLSHLVSMFFYNLLESFLSVLNKFLDLLLPMLGSFLVVLLGKTDDLLHQFFVSFLENPDGVFSYLSLVVFLSGCKVAMESMDFLHEFVVVLDSLSIHLMVDADSSLTFF